MKLPFTISFSRKRLDIEWGGTNRDCYYFLLDYNPLNLTEIEAYRKTKGTFFKKMPFWYDGPHIQGLVCWLFVIGWSTQWTRGDYEEMK